jgi:hypothetical protein
MRGHLQFQILKSQISTWFVPHPTRPRTRAAAAEHQFTLTPTAIYLRPAARCLLLTADCLLAAAYCRLLIADCPLPFPLGFWIADSLITAAAAV